MTSRGPGSLLLLCAVAAGGCGVFAYDVFGSLETGGCIDDGECAIGRCELSTGRCRECLNDVDCNDPALICQQSSCRPAAGRCRADADCGLVRGRPRCDAAQSSCVECLDSGDCGGGACTAGRCEPMSGCLAASRPEETVQTGPIVALKSEASARSYAACVEAGCCMPIPPSPGCADPGSDLPANCATFADAVRYCDYVRGRVPSADEWSLLSNSAAGRYPWGDEPAVGCETAVVAKADGAPCTPTEGPARACSVPAGHTPAGLCDAVGNLWEWTTEVAGNRQRVLRGGSYLVQNPAVLTSAYRGFTSEPERRSVDVGIRCVW